MRRGPNSYDAEPTTTTKQQLKCHNLSLVISKVYSVDLFYFPSYIRRRLNKAHRIDASKSTCRCTRLLIYFDIWMYLNFDAFQQQKTTNPLVRGDDDEKESHRLLKPSLLLGIAIAFQ